MYIFISFNTIFHSMLNEFYTFLYLSVAVMMVDNDVACSMFIFLQNCLNLSEIKLPSASVVILFDNPNSEKITLHASIKLSADMSSAFFTF